MKKKNILIAEPSIDNEEWIALKKPLSKGWLTQGPEVKRFEDKFCELHAVNHSLATTSCTTALHLALKAIDIKAGDEVIIPSFTWISTANVVLYCGGTPIFCDVDRQTFNIKIEDIKSKISKKTKAIIPVHLFGLCADIDSIKKIIPKKIKIIEDAACAAGAFYKKRPAGSLGNLAAFSFHPRKSITCGEGGILSTNDKNYFNKSEILRNHGASISEEKRHLSSRPYILPEFKELGFNYRMTDLQAAVINVQLKKLKKFINERQKWANFYTQNLKKIKWMIPQLIPNYISQHAWQSYVSIVDPKTAPYSRNKIMDLLKSRGISTRPGTHAIHMLEYYKKRFKIKPDDFPNSKFCYENSIAIPLHNKMKKSDYEYVVKVLLEINN